MVLLNSADGAQHTTKLDQEKNICSFNSQIWSKSMNKEKKNTDLSNPSKVPELGCSKHQNWRCGHRIPASSG